MTHNTGPRTRKPLLLATRNEGKVREFAEMLAGLRVDWISLNDAGVSAEVAETGKTFRENAMLKGKAYAAETGLLTMADDSGLEVDALGGQPGIYTARYGGQELTYEQRYRLLLSRMIGVPWEQRTARFIAVIALVAADGTLIGTAEGICEGLIALEPAGQGGFGYDPVFYLTELGLTMAQLDSTTKHEISHRGRALRAIEPLLRQVLSSSLTTSHSDDVE